MKALEIPRGEVRPYGWIAAEIGRPSVEATPVNRNEREAVAKVFSRFGEDMSSSTETVVVRLNSGAGGLADVVRALDAEGLKVSKLRLDEPSLDDVFLDKTGRSLEGEHDDSADEAQA